MLINYYFFRQFKKKALDSKHKLIKHYMACISVFYGLILLLLFDFIVAILLKLDWDDINNLEEMKAAIPVSNQFSLCDYSLSGHFDCWSSTVKTYAQKRALD